jgi:hypothetical protein
VDDQAVPGGTNATLVLAKVTRAQEGVYRLWARNLWGEVTSEPIRVVVSNVQVEPVVRLRWPGHPDSELTLEASHELGSGAVWLPVGTYPATDIEQRFEEPAARAAEFYRLRGSGPPATFTGVVRLGGWWYHDPVGSRHRIEYLSRADGWTTWRALTTLNLPTSPYLFVDEGSLGESARAYRTTPEP